MEMVPDLTQYRRHRRFGCLHLFTALSGTDKPDTAPELEVNCWSQDNLSLTLNFNMDLDSDLTVFT